MIFMPNIKSILFGEFVRIVDAHRSDSNQASKIHAHFPVTSVEKDFVVFDLPARPSFGVRRASKDDDPMQRRGPWILVLSSTDDVVDSAVARTRTSRAQAFLNGDEAAPTEVSGSAHPCNIIASFNNAVDAQNALRMSAKALAKLTRKQYAPAQNVDINLPQPKPRSFLKTFFSGVAATIGLLALFIFPILVKHSQLSPAPTPPAEAIAPVGLLEPGPASAIHFGPGGPTDRALYIFTDPLCADCKKMQDTIGKLADKQYDVWVFPLSVMPGSANIVASVMCSADRQKAWLSTPAINTEQNHCASDNAGDVNMKLFEAFGFNDAPTTILPNGVIVAGYKTVDELVKLLAQPAQSSIAKK